VGFDFQQAEFEDLEQADRAGANDDGIGFDDARRCNGTIHTWVSCDFSVAAA
jgi:hypothetical protein